jgi:hypothetical protein
MIIRFAKGGAMGSININKVILGGIVAGIVGNVLSFLADGVILAPQWAAAMKALGKPEFTGSQIAGFVIIGLVYGILVVWLYAAIRPRYGAGPKTAVYAGLAVWAIGVLLPNISLMGIGGLYPLDLTLETTAAGIIESVAAALAGAALYQEAVADIGVAKARAARA